jgi:O-antigen ligase
LVAFIPTVYLALSGGGFDIIVRSEIGVVIWWAVLMGALVGLVPCTRLSTAAWTALALLAGFFAWAWVATAWSHSDELTRAETARVATYLGALVLGLCVAQRDTARSLLNGVAAAIAVVTGLAVLYRIAPSLFPADTAAHFYAVSQLSYPLDYSDAVGEFAALGLPALVAIGVGGRTPVGRIGAAVGFALAAICLGMTRSNGGYLAAVVGLVVLGLLYPWPLSPATRRAAVTSLVAALMTVVVLIVVTGGAQHVWDAFKDPRMHGGLSISGSHRYQYWQAAVHAFRSQPWHGIGPGTFQFYWAQHNSLKEFVLDAHSLYFQTLAELGAVGLILVVGLLVNVLFNGVRRATRGPRSERVTAGAAIAGFAAFCAAGTLDWVWQIGVVPMVAMLLAAIALRGSNHSSVASVKVVQERRYPRGTWLVSRGVLVLAAAAALVAILVPLSETVSVRKSQANAAGGRVGVALAHAATAQRLEPGAATPWLQRALILEQLDRPGSALTAAVQAEAREPTNWRIWLVASRLATEKDRAEQALRYYVRARSLNPTSLLFNDTARLTPISGQSLRALVVPPGKAGANQYFETIPGVAGNFDPPQPGRATTPLDTPALAKLGRGRAGARALAQRGPEGLAAARLAAATAWTPTRSPASARQPRVAASGSAPLAAIADTVWGSDEGGLGFALPVILAAVLLGVLCAAIRRKRP